jgi:hypothetical protein
MADARPVNVAILGQQAINRRLKLRCAVLQAQVDKQAAVWISEIPGSIYSMSSAVAAAATYGRRFFKDKAWSDEMVVKAAKALISACEVYPSVNTSAWAEIVKRNGL